MSERVTYHLDDLEFEPQLDELRRSLKGRCAVANGCFDILHPGHLSLLAALDTIAYRRGLRPIVAINSDSSVQTLKGVRRPIVPQQARATLLNHLKWPFTVVIFDEETPQRLMDMLQPAVVVKGADYVGKQVVRWQDSEVEFVDFTENYSTSRLLGDTR